ncbi:M48 family metallopeptidase [Methanospirillum lacunae]|uniref:YgjP-like metallopeptidase domain-containing protein n=1 Tax=Methanospirillum lacunae TaxID=668570 RepID=A0A2V2N2Q7_9EURY|nr:SprT family zinc-dependent metalloprotease [Methanospirillum lacunae]PWR74049.1 hypothetical protein DK846_02510 [Methanospirillum lacunae]
MQIPLPGFSHPPLPDNFSDSFQVDGVSYHYSVKYDREISRFSTEVSEAGEFIFIAHSSLSADEIHRIVTRDGKKLFRIPAIKPDQNTATDCKNLRIGDEEVPYRIKINPRAKGMTLKINHVLQITVIVPPGYSHSDLSSFLESSKTWIAEKIGRTDLINRNADSNDSITVEGRTILYNIRRSDRAKRIVLKILADASVEVVAPPNTNSNLIHKFVTEKADWILKKITDNSRPRPPIRDYTDGDLLPLLGKEVHLSVLTGGDSSDAWFIDGKIIVKIPDGLTPVSARELVKRGYKKILTQTLEKISQEMVIRWSSRLSIQQPRIKYGEQKTHWGLCTPRGITLNIRLAMAPPDLIEYVVVHELCHILHPNHSARYWKLVEEMLPAYKDSRSRLKRDGNLFML